SDRRVATARSAELAGCAPRPRFTGECLRDRDPLLRFDTHHLQRHVVSMTALGYDETEVERRTADPILGVRPTPGPELTIGRFQFNPYGQRRGEIGRASCRQTGEMAGGGSSIKVER